MGDIFHGSRTMFQVTCVLINVESKHHVANHKSLAHMLLMRLIMSRTNNASLSKETSPSAAAAAGANGAAAAAASLPPPADDTDASPNSPHTNAPCSGALVVFTMQ